MFYLDRINTFKILVRLSPQTMSKVTTMVLAFIFSIFVLFGKDKFLNDFKGFFQAYLPTGAYKQGARIYRVVTNVFTRYIAGTLLECLILGTLVTFGCMLLKIPYAILCGCVVAIGALIPMFGALFAAIIMSIYLMFEYSISVGVTFIIMFICIQQVEGNFIYPNVVGKSIGLPAMYVIVAVTIGGSIGGILGIIICIPVFCSVYQLIQEDVEKRRSKKKSEAVK